MSYTQVYYKERLNILAYADDIALIAKKNNIEIR